MVYSEDSGSEDRIRSSFQHQDNYPSGKPDEIDEEEQKRRELEQKKRLERRIEIAEKGCSTGRQVWMDSPSHCHDAETFNNEKGNEFGKLKYNLTETERNESQKRKKDKKEKKKKKKKNKKKKKSRKAKKDSSASSSSGSESESEVEALEFNIDNIKKDINTSDEEEADKMRIDNERRVKIIKFLFIIFLKE